MNNIHKKTNSGKCKVGVGGRYCPCCTKVKPNQHKKLTNRTYRHKMRCELIKNLKEGE